MPTSSVARPWWRHPFPLFALGLHAILFFGLFQLHFKEGEWARLTALAGPDASTPTWARVLQQEHGPLGFVTWFFDAHDEIRLYHRYAQVTLRGVDPALPADAPRQGTLSPYRDVAVEYQPGALLFLLPPAIFASDYEGYQTGFVVWCGLLYTGSVLLGLRLLNNGEAIPAEQAGRALMFSGVFLLCLGPISAARFDHAVPFLCLAGAWLFQRAERTGSLGWLAVCGAWAALGAMVKVVPGVVLPAALLWLLCAGGGARPQWRRAGVLIAGFVVTLLALHGLFYAAWGDGYLRSFTYHLDRGFQVESVYAGVLMAGRGWGEVLAVEHSYGAHHVVTPVTVWLKPLALALSLVLAAVVAGRFWRIKIAAEPGVRERAMVGLMVLLLTAFMLTNKVFSPQYLLWIAPLLAAVYGGCVRLRGGELVFLLIGILSQVLFPRFYEQLTQMDPWVVGLLNGRNGLLLLLFGWLVWRLPGLLLESERDPKN